MSISYFKPRDRFDFNTDTLDIGNPISWSRKNFLRLLFIRIFAINEERIEEFYQRHLNYYLEQHPDGNEETFFRYLWDLVDRQLNVLLLKDIYDKDHVRNEREIKQLKKFTEVLILHDQWNLHKSTEAAVAAQQLEIHTLKQENTQLKAEIAEYRQFDGYIEIRDGQVLPLLDLFIKMQALKTPEGDGLLITPAQNTWAKMISKYFREVDSKNTGQTKEIKIERVRYYLRGIDPKDATKREHEIPKKHQLYTISNLKTNK
ncbi:hypothetical protein [Pedobacter gandavensis]|uniref:hypothetical protein n=1 Tax=Pedobacter gandavensis TaxID=2679963 RepID=UPI00292FBC62|nr:hypothetical protein [Pedobacter gandavensis]